MLYFVVQYLGITNGCQMRWNYFGTAHVKGEIVFQHNTFFAINSCYVFNIGSRGFQFVY